MNAVDFDARAAEIHLHPQVQAELADVFISAIKAYENGRPRNVQLIVESHSEHFLNRLQRRIAEGQIGPDEVAIYFSKAGSAGAELEELRVNELGDIINWPDNFFLVTIRRSQAERKTVNP